MSGEGVIPIGQGGDAMVGEPEGAAPDDDIAAADSNAADGAASLEASEEEDGG